jgi:acetyl esterase/lipase
MTSGRALDIDENRDRTSYAVRIQSHLYSYGPHPSQTVHLHLPSGSHIPVVVVIHGGYWRARHGADLAEPLGLDLTRFGVGAAVIEYRRVGEGGGWPTTLADAARAVDSLAAEGQRLAEGRLLVDRVAAIGHSAGGHLAAWLAHRRSLRAGTAGSVGPGESYVPLAGVVTQAGLLDLVSACDERLGDGAVIDLMEGQARSMPQRYHHASPLAHVGDGARVVCVHGDADDTVPLSQSERYATAALAAGDPVQLVVLPGVGHYELIDPADPAWEICRDRALRMV